MKKLVKIFFSVAIAVAVAVGVFACDSGLKAAAKKIEGKPTAKECEDLENIVKNDSEKYKELKDSATINDTLFNNYLVNEYKFSCNKDSLTAYNGPYDIDILLENSYSMDSYTSGATDLKKYLSEILNYLKISDNNLNLFYANSRYLVPDSSEESAEKVIRSVNVKNYENWRKEDTASNSKTKGSNKPLSKVPLISAIDTLKIVPHIVDSALNRLSYKKMSMLVSDFDIFARKNDIGKVSDPAKINSSIEIQRSEIKQAIQNKIKEIPDLSLLVFKMNSNTSDCRFEEEKCIIDSSSFKGLVNEIHYSIKVDSSETKTNVNYKKYIKPDSSVIYYRYKDTIVGYSFKGVNIRKAKTEIGYTLPSNVSIEGNQGIEKPFFIWLFGTESQIDNAIKYLEPFVKNMASEELDVIKFSAKKEKTNGFAINNYASKSKTEKEKEIFYSVRGKDSIDIGKTKDGKAVFKIKIDVDYGMLAKINPDFFANTAKFTLSDTNNFIFNIETANNKKYTHVIFLKSKNEPPFTKETEFNNPITIKMNENSLRSEPLLTEIQKIFAEKPIVQIKIGVK